MLTLYSSNKTKPTNDFVLLAIPDGSAEQTLYLIARVSWVFTL